MPINFQDIAVLDRVRACMAPADRTVCHKQPCSQTFTWKLEERNLKEHISLFIGCTWEVTQIWTQIKQSSSHGKDTWNEMRKHNAQGKRVCTTVLYLYRVVSKRPPKELRFLISLSYYNFFFTSLFLLRFVTCFSSRFPITWFSIARLFYTSFLVYRYSNVNIVKWQVCTYRNEIF